MRTPHRKFKRTRIMSELGKLIIMIFSRDVLSGLYRQLFGD